MPLFLTMLLLVSAGCKGGADKKVTLTLLFHDGFQYEYFLDLQPINDAYQKINPNVTIEIEKVKDSGDLESSLKIRKSADELPDIMLLKPYMLANFKDILADLSSLKIINSNLYAKAYAVEGKVVGIPESAFYEFVYYRKSIFREYGISVPTTWDEFVDAAKLIKAKGEYIPIAMGGKDAWPDYPFNEFMPCLQAGDGQLWNVMAQQNEPFSAGEPFYEAYKKIMKLYDAKVFGDDPLGLGWDQAKGLFIGKKSAMIVAGQWFISDYKSGEGDMADLGLFFLPVRASSSEPFYATVMADGFFATPKDGKNLEEAKKFIEWYFTSDYYKTYLSQKGVNPTMQGVTIDNAVLNEPFENNKDVKFIVYDGGNSQFQQIVNTISFDVKKMGQDMMGGKDFETMMKDLNKKWEDAL